MIKSKISDAVIIAGLSILLSAVAFTRVASAQETPEPELETPAGTLREIEDALKTKAAEEAKLKQEAEARAQEIRKLRYRLIETADSIQNSEREIARIERELTRLEAEEKDAAVKLQAEQGNLSEVLAALQAFELSQPPALLVSPDDANQAARAALLLSEAAPALAAKAQTLKDLVDQLTSARNNLADQRAAYERTALSLASRRKFLADDLQIKEQERDVADRLAAAAQRETATLAARATSIKGVVARLREVAHSITPRPKPAKAPAETAPIAVAEATPSTSEDAPKGIAIINRSEAETKTDTSLASIRREDVAAVFKPAISFVQARGVLKMPVVGRITTKFGQRDKLGDRFDGIRIAVRDGAIVTSPYEAKVAFAQNWEPTGNMIVLDVGGGYHILMMGIGGFLVEAGQIVNAGEPLAEMAGERAFLDLQIRRKGEPVNPAQWLSAKSVAEANF